MSPMMPPLHFDLTGSLSSDSNFNILCHLQCAIRSETLRGAFECHALSTSPRPNHNMFIGFPISTKTPLDPYRFLNGVTSYYILLHQSTSGCSASGCSESTCAARDCWDKKASPQILHLW